MKIGDIVQVRRFDGVDHWLFAVIQALPAGGDMVPARVQIQHPGNPEDGEVLMVPASDVRTKADVQAILTQAQAIVANPGQLGIGEPKIRQLAALDGFWANFLPPADGRLTAEHSKHLSNRQTTVHKHVVKHYQEQIKRLS